MSGILTEWEQAKGGNIMAKTERIYFRVSDTEKAQIEEIAKKEGLTISAWLTMLTKREINKSKGAKDMKIIKCRYEKVVLNVGICDGEMKYQNPITGQWMETIQQCFAGWQERSEEDSNDWAMLETEIRNCDFLEEWIEEGRQEVDFSKENYMNWEAP